MDFRRLAAGLIFAGLLLLPLATWCFALPQELPLVGGIQCPLLYYTGLPCAGCGMTRAMYAVFHGRFIQAFHHNALFFLPLLIWGCLLYISGAKALFNRDVSPKIPLYGVPAMLALVVVYWVWRIAVILINR